MQSTVSNILSEFEAGICPGPFYPQIIFLALSLLCCISGGADWLVMIPRFPCWLASRLVLQQEALASNENKKGKVKILFLFPSYLRQWLWPCPEQRLLLLCGSAPSWQARSSLLQCCHTLYSSDIITFLCPWGRVVGKWRGGGGDSGFLPLSDSGLLQSRVLPLRSSLPSIGKNSVKYSEWFLFFWGTSKWRYPKSSGVCGRDNKFYHSTYISEGQLSPYPSVPCSSPERSLPAERRFYLCPYSQGQLNIWQRIGTEMHKPCRLFLGDFTCGYIFTKMLNTVDLGSTQTELINLNHWVFVSICSFIALSDVMIQINEQQ